ncbi:MAG: Cys-tRNA(Pro) deacylase, partial [Firmicutes bacterium]|nr:Cys-tRNA(Pro) deacylase [Bacillota bacterium]
MSKEKKTNAMRILDTAGIQYQEYQYDCKKFIDGIESTKALGKPLEISYKTLVLTGRSGGHYVLVIPVEREIDLKKAASAVGEKSVEMVHVKDITALTGYIRGGVSPIGMKKPFPTVIDESALLLDLMLVSGGRIGVSIELAPEDLAKAV